jgi:hypothetical protein
MFSLKTMKRYSIEKMCKVLQLVKGDYQWKANLFLIGNKELCLLKKNNSIYFESKQRYGSPRMTVELALGSKVSRITVAKYMNQLFTK